jgi:hypothetical protein
MSALQVGEAVGMTCFSARRGASTGALFAGLVALAMLVVLVAPSTAAAHPVAPPCPESWNPHGQTVPPAGWSTEPGTNPNSGQNPDGFFEVISGDGHDVTLFDGCPVGFGGVEGDDGGTGFEFGTFESGTHIKYTEANGKDPAISPMAGNNGPGGGQAVSVEWHLWGQGDLWVCDALDLSSCNCCRVSPPPR